MLLAFKETNSGWTQAGGAQTVTVAGDDYKPYQRSTIQVTVKAGTATTGSVAISVIPYPYTTFESVYDENGAALTISLATQQTVEFNGAITAIKFTPTAADGTYGAAVTVWQEKELVA